MSGSLIRTCPACGVENRIAAARIAEPGRCGRCKAELPPIAEPVDVDAELLAEVVSSASVPILIDFWAGWCGPCRAAAPHVKQVAADRAGSALVLKVDTDRHPDLAEYFQVMGIPTFAVIRDRRVVSRHVGMADAREMNRWLEAAESAAASAAGARRAP